MKRKLIIAVALTGTAVAAGGWITLSENYQVQLQAHQRILATSRKHQVAAAKAEAKAGKIPPIPKVTQIITSPSSSQPPTTGTGPFPKVTQTVTSPSSSGTGPLPPIVQTPHPRWGTNLITQGLGVVGSVWNVAAADGGPGIVFTKEVNGQGVIGFIGEGVTQQTMQTNTWSIPNSSGKGIPMISAVVQGQVTILFNGGTSEVLNLKTGTFAP